jgi:membrane-bound lytic murein transglycosylase D
MAALICAPLTLFCVGCPSNDPLAGTAGSPVKTSAKQTAPTIAPAPQAKPQTGAQAPAAPPQSQAAATAVQAADQNAVKAQQLISKAEAIYSSGVENYRGGRLDAARMDFDFAVDTMLTSGLNLKSDGPLADEFDRLVNAVNALEMAALKQGNGFSPKLDAAPIDAENDITFAPNPELVAKLKTELNVQSDLPLIINDQVAGYIGIFSNSTSFRNHMAASLERVGKYKTMIQKVLAEESVPQDLIYLAVAESGFQPQALNARSGAGGMWQFMPTGAYGLTRNGFFDERFDPEKSSRAYARYIKSLYGQFGDWYLAMAAYDWGPGNIQRAVQRTGYADFWELYRRNAMPKETRAYVPQILAAVIMAKNPEKYGLDKVIPDEPVLYDTVNLDYAIDLRLAADVTGATVQELVGLNPSLLRLSTPRDMSFDLHIPLGTSQLFKDRLKDIPEDRRASWRFHIVKPGETLNGIAESLHAKVSEIAATNGISTQDPMGVDDELVVPVAAANGGDNPLRYTTRRGDTLVTVADRFNVTVDELRRWNNLKTGALLPGHAMYVAEPVRLGPSMRTRGRSAPAKKGRKGASTAATHAPAHTPAKSSTAPSKSKTAPAKSSTAHPKAPSA